MSEAADHFPSGVPADPENALQSQSDRWLAAWLAASRLSDLQALRPAIDWDRFVAAAGRRGLSGLLLGQADRLGLSLPPPVAHSLRQRSLGVAAAELHAAAELEPVVRALHQAGIEVMLLKGAALQRTVYHRPGLRPMCDVDLLVRYRSAVDAVGVLVDQGCRLGMELVGDDFFATYYFERELMTASPTPLRIDLHARPFRPLPTARTVPDNALWSDARTVEVGKVPVRIPRVELMFLHLAVHAAFHGCDRLLWLYDLKRVAGEAGDAMDWSLITRRACDWRLSLPLLFALEKTGELLGPVCPHHVIATLRSHRTGWKDRLVLRQAPRDADSPAMHVAVNVLCTPGIRFRLGYLRAMLLPGRGHLGDVYPFRHPGWTACAHVWRLIRACGRLSAVPFRALAGKVGSNREVWPAENPVS
ncbi:MAG: nucleotidyltransferase family protein [Phycisphaerae bacterium]